MTTAIVCIGLLGLLLFGLGLGVSLARGKHDFVIGTPPDPSNGLHKMIRAHGNTAEFAPMIALLIWVAAQRDPATWVLWAMGVATAGRFLIVAGLLMSKSLADVQPLRFLGALATYLAGAALAVAVLLSLQGAAG